MNLKLHRVVPLLVLLVLVLVVVGTAAAEVQEQQTTNDDATTVTNDDDANNANNANNYDHGTALRHWLTSSTDEQHNGGYMHSALQMFQLFANAPFYGIRTSSKIAKDELLLEIPRHLLVTPDIEQQQQQQPEEGGETDVDEDVLHVGDRVESVMDNDDVYLGTITAVHYEKDDQMYYYNVLYDDGDVGEEVHGDTLYKLEDCATVMRLLEQSKKLPQSTWKPYMDYLLSQPTGQLPAGWSTAGKQLLNDVLGRNVGITVPSRLKQTDPNTTEFVGVTHVRPNYPPLPPHMMDSDGLNQDFIKRCLGGVRFSEHPKGGFDHPYKDDEAALVNFYHLLSQRGWDEVMIPVFDMMSHGNGRLLNTFHPSIRVTDEDGIFTGLKEEPVRVYAARDIPEGEELYTTYNMCADCQNRFMGYGTPELLRDYGFVEGMPQRWFFEWPVPENKAPIEVGFELDYADPTKPDENDLKLAWLTKHEHLTHPTLIRYFRWHIRRLEQMERTILAANNDKKCPEDVPEFECTTIVKYHQHVLRALKEGLKAAGRAISEEQDQDCQDDTSKAGYCTPPAIESVYDPLEPPEGEEEWIENRPDTCDEGDDSERSPFYTNEFEYREQIQSPYQKIEFTINKSRNNDSCFQLDGVTQICTSYRPDYHEMVVHNTARYLETDIKRVAFVGGGDSMLLHNIIQYPTLEKVIGLEIDQFVTRGSFKHFGTSPHWDEHEKVEWWFGDATKTLPMLPKDYFGSFDLVLIDLSETVASLSVTDDLNIMEAMSLLLQPRGILVKNEYMYFKEQSHIYKEAMHIHWYTLPYVCSQSLILASNAIDFMRADYKKRDVKTLLPLLDKDDIQYGYLHDYQKNYGHSKWCIDNTGTKFVEPETQERSPGVMMIIEAENANEKSLTTNSLKKTLEKIVKKHGFNVVTTLVPGDIDNGIVVTILKEGYVVARTFPDKKYCAFDVQLWGSFSKQDDVKKALIEAVGSKVRGGDSSSYRIVSGGMFGLATWKDDQKLSGPKIVKCDEDTTTNLVFDEPSDLAPAVSAVGESLKLIVDSDFTVLVLCGAGAECKTADEVKADQSPAANVIVLKPCASIVEDGFEYTADALKRMSDCEVEIWNILDAEVSKIGQRIRAVVLDPTAPQSLAQLVLKMFTSAVNKKRFLTPYGFVSAPVYDMEQVWRGVFTDKFRTEIFPVDPTFRSDIYVNNTADGTSFMMSLFSSGDSHFGEKLVQYANQLETTTTGVTTEIRNVRGNTFDGFQVLNPIDTTGNFTDADFDQQDNLKQWYGQQPLGFQILFQFEMKTKDRLNKTRKAFKASINSLFVPADQMVFETFSDLGDGELAVAVWSGGSAMFVYDGRTHADVNLFLYEEDFRMMDRFEKDFVGRVNGMIRTLRDTQPRGIGHVINFQKDLKGKDGDARPRPKWQTIEL